jgi:hypothetical protein
MSPDDSDMDSGLERYVDPVFIGSCLVGVALGAVTVIVVHALFPTTADGWILSLAKADAWKPPAVLIVSGILILALYVAGRSIGAVQLADALVLGYVGALVLAAVCAISQEMFFMIRAHVPENLGVKNVALTSLVRRC